MTMTESTIIETKRSRGRPFGSFGPRRRQKQLAVEFLTALGGRVTPWQENLITRAVMLLSIAEQKRLEIDKLGGSAEDMIALARLEEVADAAVARLGLPSKQSDRGRD
jgi:hypothetical protein